MSEFEKSNFDPKAAAEARKKEMEQMAEKLEAGVKEVFQGENYKKYLDFCAKLPRYSVNNQLLIMMQKPYATMCQSYTGWKEMNRYVRKGEKGIRVLAPSPYKMEREQEKKDPMGNTILDSDGEPVKEIVEIKVNAFKPVSTFDITQTEGEPVPTLGVDELTGSVEGYELLMQAIKEASPVPISFEEISSGAKGYFQVEENRIAIQEGMSEMQTVKTALHETSHATLHSKEKMNENSDKKSRNQKECEAESVAYVVCQHYGLDTAEYSFPYVAGWSSNKEIPELKESLETIRRAASELIVKIDEKISEITHSRDIVKSVENEIEEMGTEQPFGFISITPSADFIPNAPEKKIEITLDQYDRPEVDSNKKSIKDVLADKKEKSEHRKKQKVMETKDMGEAI